MATFQILLLSAAAHGLVPLEPCEAGGRGGRWGLCGVAGGAAVTLRGSNYIRLGPSSKMYHSTFDQGTYNRSRFAAAFDAMRRDGYNVNRVFLDELANRGIGGNASDPSAPPLDGAMLDRIAEYVGDAAERHIYTIVTMVYVPVNAYFRNFTQRLPAKGPEWADSWNAEFLTAAGQGAFAEYARLLGAGLAQRLPAAKQSAVLVSLQNEFFLRGDEFPFGVRNITVTLGDGVAYDMALASARQQAADANTNLWAQRARAAIRAHLPAALVTVGVFTFFAVGKTGPSGLLLDGCTAADAPSRPGLDCRFPARPSTLSRSGIDFLDVHIYEANGSAAALDANLRTEEWSMIPATMPIVMGEFGCNKEWGLDANSCAPRVRELQISSCARGFSGWLFWTYDCEEQPDPHWYTLVEGGGAINAVLAPALNADPCEL